ncbi:NAD(P)/FAD-dependent oxidoreductase [Flavimarina sp. Hel_I_48]|uniref:NAD(P)/FAD-dependent oxidoreductase n=1 Tax=Flavimarina sp. Hel_I_48 TaxID=1392488 RepID=UPI0004DF0018|nr:NAD(P)/FAD-dependent oxidoreductase [Flavimarina sp. Hel_I_48]
MNYDVMIVGGGAAGFFTALNLAERNPSLRIAIIERGASCLEKVRISGGGRCNVTHAEFLPRPLSVNYPRGEKELLGPFNRFMTGDTMAWFEERNVPLKIEEDGRVFPTSDSSETIINCFEAEAEKYGIQILLKHALKDLRKTSENWYLSTSSGDFSAKKVVFATGSNPKIWKLLAGLGHSYTSPVPSLFTFNCKDPRISELPGLTTNVEVQLLASGEEIVKNGRSQRVDRGGLPGPLLITHWGFSGPAILKLSAWGAHELAEMGYTFKIAVNWLPEHSPETALKHIEATKITLARQQVSTNVPFDIPKRLWQKLVAATLKDENRRWADLNKQEMLDLTDQLTHSVFSVAGKSSFKEEFVTAGGINLQEVDFKTFGSKVHPNLYFAGEILNIDAITGGFNFQNAWTSGFVVANAIQEHWALENAG